MMKNLLFLTAALFFVACNQTGNAGGEVDEAAGYVLFNVPGSSIKKAERKDDDGNLMVEGFLDQGVKIGTWVEYHPGKHFPKTISNFVNGLYNGPYLELNERGQIELRATYKNNKLDGPWGKYRFGRPAEEANYKDGKLDGEYRVYYTRDGKLQSSTMYKNGLQHGAYRFYNEEGAVTLEYEFKNGEKISGGIVNPDSPNEPK